MNQILADISGARDRISSWITTKMKFRQIHSFLEDADVEWRLEVVSPRKVLQTESEEFGISGILRSCVKHPMSSISSSVSKVVMMAAGPLMQPLSILRRKSVNNFLKLPDSDTPMYS
eukprot:ANDGO_01160.mRNA.1 hypothetical protein